MKKRCFIYSAVIGFSCLYTMLGHTQGYKGEREHTVVSIFRPHVVLSGGYGNFQDMSSSTGQTGVTRLALGTQTKSNPLSLGVEIGVQSGNRMPLPLDLTAPVFGGIANALPVFLTIKPPVDFLVMFKYQFKFPLFVQAKAGTVYLKTMIDNANISSESLWKPEIQAGVGWKISSNYRLSLNYQRFFGQAPILTDLNFLRGTAALSHVPIWQAGLLSLEIDL